MTPMCMIYLPQVEFLGRGRRPSEGWKEVSNAVGGRPWPPHSKQLSSIQKNRVSVKGTIREHSNGSLKLFPLLSFHQSPHLACRATGSGYMALGEFRVALGHLDVGVAQDFCEFVQVPAVHHVPRGKRVPQIVKSEILDSGHG